MEQKFKQDISIGNNLRLLREKNNFTQEQIAVKLQVLGLPVSREIISQMERGVYSIRISVFLALKKIYKAEYADFFKGVDQ